MTDLGFNYFVDRGFDCWVKRYAEFRLYVAESQLGLIYASILINELEIGLPEIKDFAWIETFDEENK